MKKETIRNLLAASILACTASASQAALLESWDYAINMYWDTSTTQYTGDVTKKDQNGLHYISWGHSNGNPGNIRLYSHDDNGKLLEEWKTSGNIQVDGGPPHIGQFTALNVYTGTRDTYDSALKFTTLVVSLDVMLPGTTNVIENFTVPFTVHYSGTANCTAVFGVDAAGFNFSKTLDYDGWSYTFNFSEGGLATYGYSSIKPLSDANCRSLGLGSGCQGFESPVGSTTFAWFHLASVTAAPIPEPETYAMMLAGLGLIGAVARRRRKGL